jgi:hypothetical protein
MCPLSIVVGRERFPTKPTKDKNPARKTAYDATPYRSAKVLSRILGVVFSTGGRGADIGISVDCR